MKPPYADQYLPKKITLTHSIIQHKNKICFPKFYRASFPFIAWNLNLDCRKCAYCIHLSQITLKWCFICKQHSCCKCKPCWITNHSCVISKSNTISKHFSRHPHQEQVWGSIETCDPKAIMQSFYCWCAVTAMHAWSPLLASFHISSQDGVCVCGWNDKKAFLSEHLCAN